MHVVTGSKFRNNPCGSMQSCDWVSPHGLPPSPLLQQRTSAAPPAPPSYTTSNTLLLRLLHLLLLLSGACAYACIDQQQKQQSHSAHIVHLTRWFQGRGRSSGGHIAAQKYFYVDHRKVKSRYEALGTACCSAVSASAAADPPPPKCAHSRMQKGVAALTTDKMHQRVLLDVQ